MNQLLTSEDNIDLGGQMLLCMRRNAAIPPCSRVQLIARVAPCRALSRVGLPCPPNASDSFPSGKALHPNLSAYLPHLV